MIVLSEIRNEESIMSENAKLDIPDSRCNETGHSQHLCTLTDQYFHINCAEQYRTLVKNPEFKCKFCGRTAKNGQSLCYPDEL